MGEGWGVSFRSLIRGCGLAAALAGVLLLISDVLELVVFGVQPPGAGPFAGGQSIVAGLFLVAALSATLGLVGLYVSQATAAGLPGLASFLVAFVGTTLVAGTFWSQMFFAPAVARVAPQFFYNDQPAWLNFGFFASFFVFLLGWLLFGAATYRAGVRPRWAAVLLMAGVVLIVLPLPFASLVFDAAVIWLGLDLFAEYSENKPEAPDQTTEA